MQYLGGKHFQAGKIIPILETSRKPGSRFVDACCGAITITAGMKGPRLANDACVPLINLFRGWQEGWRPPENISEEEYLAIKAGPRDPTDPLTAFAGFGLSYGAKYFDSFARSWKLLGKRTKYVDGATPVNFSKLAANSLARKMNKCQDVEWSSKDLFDLEIRPTDLVYIDPPYFGRGQYAYFGKEKFPYNRMIEQADAWARSGATVFISEYAQQSPTWEQVGEFKTKGCFADKDSRKKTDKLFRVTPT